MSQEDKSLNPHIRLVFNTRTGKTEYGVRPTLIRGWTGTKTTPYALMVPAWDYVRELNKRRIK